jgi:hypothetical protein
VFLSGILVPGTAKLPSKTQAASSRESSGRARTVFCKDDRGWLRHSVTNPMATRAQECHAMAFDSTNCHSSGILRSRMPQPWHSFHQTLINGISTLAKGWHSVRQILPF